MDKKMESMECACDRAAELHRNGCSSLDNWIAWADALLGIAGCHHSLYSKRLFIEDAIHKLETALSKDITNPHVNWCMGNAQLAYGSASGDLASARQHFRMASVYFGRAVSLEPDNDKYAKSLRMAKQVYGSEQVVKDFTVPLIRLIFLIPFALISCCMLWASRKP